VIALPPRRAINVCRTAGRPQGVLVAGQLICGHCTCALRTTPPWCQQHKERATASILSLQKRVRPATWCRCLAPRGPAAHNSDAASLLLPLPLQHPPPVLPALVPPSTWKITDQTTCGMLPKSSLGASTSTASSSP
jgi:hypothetical protein